MTYLFVVIGVSVINSLANQKMSYTEIIGGNSLIVIALYILERVWVVKKHYTSKIKYEVLENIKPGNHSILKQDLEMRTGFNINKIEIKDIDFLKKSVSILITYTN
jgi:hypothetical protein